MQFDITPVTTSGQGLLLAIEGGDGVGKSTAVKYLRDYINQRCRDPNLRGMPADANYVYLTREPGGTPFNEKTRDLFLNADISPRTSVVMITAMRNDHFEKVIDPIIGMGGIVITDRYLMSTHAYQSAAGEEFIDMMHDLVVSPDGYGMPNFTLVLTAPLEVTLERLAKRNGHPTDRFENDSVAIQERRLGIYERYTYTCCVDDSIIHITAEGDEASVQAQLRAFVDDILFPSIWGADYAEWKPDDLDGIVAQVIDGDDTMSIEAGLSQ